MLNTYENSMTFEFKNDKNVYLKINMDYEQKGGSLVILNGVSNVPCADWEVISQAAQHISNYGPCKVGRLDPIVGLFADKLFQQIIYEAPRGTPKTTGLPDYDKFIEIIHNNCPKIYTDGDKLYFKTMGITYWGGNTKTGHVCLDKKIINDLWLLNIKSGICELSLEVCESLLFFIAER